MNRRVGRWMLLSFAAGLGLIACIDDPEFHQAGESAPATGAAAETPAPTPTPVVTGKDADATDDDDDPKNYVPDGGVAGPGTTACGGQVCAVGRMCCKDKCKPAKSKC